jgi:hypothetical protein
LRKQEQRRRQQFGGAKTLLDLRLLLVEPLNRLINLRALFPPARDFRRRQAEGWDGWIGHNTALSRVSAGGKCKSVVA